MARRRRKKKRSGGSGLPAKQLRLELSMLEMARGHDGSMRGRPEPALIVAVYLASKSGDRLLTRALRRLPAKRGGMPQDIATSDAESELAAVRFRPSSDDRLLLLVIAIEEDAGSDIEAVYANVSHLDRWRAWPVDAAVPNPEHLEEIASAWMEDDRLPRRVQLMLSDQDLRDRVRADDYVGASLLGVAVGRSRDDELRLVLACEANKNDWTAVLRLRVR